MIELTTNHASSSYGIPVLLVDGVAFGPADSIKHLEIDDPFGFLSPEYSAADYVYYNFMVYEAGYALNGADTHPKKELQTEDVRRFLGNCEHCTTPGSRWNAGGEQ